MIGRVQVKYEEMVLGYAAVGLLINRQCGNIGNEVASKVPIKVAVKSVTSKLERNKSESHTAITEAEGANILYSLKLK